MKHITVLKDEALTALALMPDALVVDCTFGGGGHSAAILGSLGPAGNLLGFDADQTALDEAPGSVSSDKRTTLINANFRSISTELESRSISSVNAILADLGWRSEQFSGGGKGFSFQDDEPLLMTFGDPETHTFTALDVVNDWEEESIADIIFGYGEERGSRLIAAAIVTARKEAEIKSSKQLADIIDSAVGHFYRSSRIHPATKTFQAIRIAVNDELGALTELLNEGFELLAPEGRMAIITFHSLEDRLVKQFFKEKSHDHSGVLVTKKPVTPTDEEVKTNPRSRSAKLRTIEKI